VKVYISVDMEGVAGVVHVDQTRRSGHDYERARRWMTAEANAAALGAFEAGATRVLINDSHGDMRNLVLEELDRRVEVVSGALKTWSMVERVDGGFDAALFIGYHGGAGTKEATLDHTYFGRVVHKVWLGDTQAPECWLNAYVAGQHAVPVVLLSGDEATCRQAEERLPGIRTVAVKKSLTRYAAESLHPLEAQDRIRAGVKSVLGQSDRWPEPLRWPGKIPLKVELHDCGMADACMLMPDAERVGPTTVGYQARDAATMLKALQTFTLLADSSRPT
jgi:D-amino peptidase